MTQELLDAIDRVNHFLEGYAILAQGGNDPDVIFSAWVLQEDQPRPLFTADLRLLTEEARSVGGRPVTPMEAAQGALVRLTGAATQLPTQDQDFDALRDVTLATIAYAQADATHRVACQLDDVIERLQRLTEAVNNS